VDNIYRLEIWSSSVPSSEFPEYAITGARGRGKNWGSRIPGIKDVTNTLVISPSIAVLPQKTDAIELICSRFHLVVMQLRDRRAGHETLDVEDEYDVQLLWHALLRMFFDDVREEESTPSFAGKSARMDFLLPVEQLVIETKMTRKGLGAKEIGDELIIDSARYSSHPSCKKLICFVYDPLGLIANPRGLESDLSKPVGGLEVKVIVAPRTA
jgi:hypothetical protein